MSKLKVKQEEGRAQDASSSQYDPNSGVDSYLNEGSDSRSVSGERLSYETNKKLTAWIRKTQKELTNSEKKHNLIKE